MLYCKLRLIRKFERVSALREYHTEQRKRLLTFFENHPDEQFSIDMLADSIKCISISALYRNINQMVKDGKIRRFQENTDRKSYYQYMGHPQCVGHFHLQCSACGSILHMDKATSEKLIQAIAQTSSFTLDENETILLGHCKTCK